METESTYEQDAYLTTQQASILAIDGQNVLLDQSIFYPVGGGQPGDIGTLTLNGEVFEVVDTSRGRDDRNQIWVSVATPFEDQLSIGASVVTEIDWERRYRHMRLHTSLHLLCSLIDAPVTGCNISTEKGRIDFDLPEPTVNKQDITKQLNELIVENTPVGVRHMTPEEVLESGLTRTAAVAPPAVNGQVRIVDIQGVDYQPCGGTHVKATGEIGDIVCSKIKKVGRHARRIELAWAQ